MLHSLTQVGQWITALKDSHTVNNNRVLVAKTPVDAKTYSPVSVKDRGNFLEYEDAKKLVDADERLGLGFVFTKDDDFCGVDFDIKPASEDVTPSVDELKAAFKVAKKLAYKSGSYCELSNSKRGIHVIGTVDGGFGDIGTKKTLTHAQVPAIPESVTIGVEMYTHSRYFLCTGQKLTRSVDITVDIGDYCTKLVRLCQASRKNKDSSPKETGASGLTTEAGELISPPMADEMVLDLISSSKQGFSFLSLHNHGELEGHHNDLSRAVFAWHSMLSFYTQDFEQITRLFKKSKLAELEGCKWLHKWDRLGEEQHNKIVEGLTRVYGLEPARDEYIELLVEKFGHPKRDLFTGDLFVYHEQRWKNVFENEVFQTLKKFCQRRESLRPTWLEPSLYAYTISLEPELLVSIPNWDGIDRIEDMADKLTLEHEDLENWMVAQILKDVMAKMYLRMFNPKIQNRCLILAGGQGIGKDVFLDTLVGGLGHYKANIVIDKHSDEKTIAESTVGVGAVVISEFDKIKDVSSSVIKDVITKEHFRFRGAYERKAKTYDNRCSYFGACNADQVLTDVTGNRRFVVIRLDGKPGEAIDWNFDSSHNGQMQILAQAKVLAQQGFKSHPEAERVLQQITTEYTPDDPLVDAIQDFDKVVELMLENRRIEGQLLTFADVESECRRISRIYGFYFRDFLTALKTHKRMVRTRANRLYGTEETTRCKDAIRISEERIRKEKGHCSLEEDEELH